MRKLWKENIAEPESPIKRLYTERGTEGGKGREGERLEKNTFPGHKLSVFPEIP